MPAAVICPICGAAAVLQPTYKHRWICCPACGCLSRRPRARLPSDALPVQLRRLLPHTLLRDAAFHADPQGAYFGSTASTMAPFAAEADRVVAELDRLGLSGAHTILDVGGGPGIVAERLGRGGRAEVTLLEYARPALEHAQKIGVDGRFFDFQGHGVPEVVSGPFEVVLCRFALGWCLDLVRLAEGLTAVAAPEAAVVLWLLRPGRGALLTCALDDHGPVVMWSEAHVAEVFGRLGWRLAGRSAPLEPMPFWAPRGWWYRAFSQPWLWRPGPLGVEPLQHHQSLVLRRGPSPHA